MFFFCSPLFGSTLPSECAGPFAFVAAFPFLGKSHGPFSIVTADTFHFLIVLYSFSFIYPYLAWTAALLSPRSSRPSFLSLPSEHSWSPINGPGMRLSSAPDHTATLPTPFSHPLLMLFVVPCFWASNFFGCFGFGVFGLMVWSSWEMPSFQALRWGTVSAQGGDNRGMEGPSTPHQPGSRLWRIKVWIDCRE